MSKNINLSESSTTGPNFNKVHNLDWIDINARCSSGDTLLKRAPAKHAAALAQVGMVVSVPDLLEGNGIIVAVYPDHAIIEGENEERVMALWGEIAIEVVEPDPAELPVAVIPAECDTSKNPVASEPGFVQREDWYHPEVSEWLYFAEVMSADGKTLAIYENSDDPKKQYRGALVATVTIAAEFGRKDAKNIANLMAAAPALFQHVRNLAGYAVEEAHGLDDFNAAVETMFLAIGHYPFEMPGPEADDEICKRVNKLRGRIPKRHEAA